MQTPSGVSLWMNISRRDLARAATFVVCAPLVLKALRHTLEKNDPETQPGVVGMCYLDGVYSQPTVWTAALECSPRAIYYQVLVIVVLHSRGEPGCPIEYTTVSIGQHLYPDPTRYPRPTRTWFHFGSLLPLRACLTPPPSRENWNERTGVLFCHMNWCRLVTEME